MTEVIQLARELGKAIQANESYKLYNEARVRADSDKALQELIGEFNLKRMDLSNAMSGETEPDQAKIEALDSELKRLYNSVMSHPMMEQVNDAKQGMDTMVSFVNQILVASVNGDDPDSVEQASSCGGSCSSCNGCH